MIDLSCGEQLVQYSKLSYPGGHTVYPTYYNGKWYIFGSLEYTLAEIVKAFHIPVDDALILRLKYPSE